MVNFITIYVENREQERIEGNLIFCWKNRSEVELNEMILQAREKKGIEYSYREEILRKSM